MLEAANLTASEALEANVIDFIAEDLTTLLAMVDGFTVSVGGEDVVIDTSEANIELIEPDWRYELLGIITDPNVAYILLMIGIYGLILEFYSPGVGIGRGSRRDLPVARRFRIADAADQLRRPGAVDRRHRAVGGGGVFAQLRRLWRRRRGSLRGWFHHPHGYGLARLPDLRTLDRRRRHPFRWACWCSP